MISCYIVKIYGPQMFDPFAVFGSILTIAVTAVCKKVHKVSFLDLKWKFSGGQE